MTAGMTKASRTMPESTTGNSFWVRITVIVVTHHSAAAIGNCLKNFTDAPNIVVVDNASDDETLNIVLATVPQARILRNKIGVGYPGGANLGLSQVETEFALTVNPDSVVRPEDVAALLDAADRFPEGGILCPQNINLDGSLEWTHDVVMFKRHSIPFPYNKRQHEPVPEGDLCAEFVSGAVNLIRMSVIHELGGFDEKLFLYFDDDDLCMRMRAAGYPLILAPQARIIHINAGSVRPSLHYHWEKFWNYGWARLYLEKKHRGARAMRGLALRQGTRFLLKALGYSLTFGFNKALRDWARFMGTIAFVIGVRAVDPRWKIINEKERQKISCD